MADVTIVGLGPGAPELLTMEARTVLESIGEIWLRTRQHPVVDVFPETLKVHSFDTLYETSPDFSTLYRDIADTVLNSAAAAGHIVYGVPGSPWVAETTVQHIVAGARERGITVRIVHGLSFLEPTLAALEVDGVDGLQIDDATALAGRYFPSFEPDRPALIAQVYDRFIASEVKLVLMEVFPPEHTVRRVNAAGTTEQEVASLPLHMLDHTDDWGLLSSLYVPPLDAPASMTATMNIIAHLRSPEGCPWDREQDHRSLRPFLLEETYETLEALDAGDPETLHAELGDLLLQIVLHAQIASEYQEFTIADVITTLNEKMIRRHPHVFGDVAVTDASEVLHNWEAIKREERAENGEGGDERIDDLPATMPALLRAQKILRRARKRGHGIVGFDQALAEWRANPSDGTLGTLLLALTAAANDADLDAESALRTAVADLIVTKSG